MKIHLIRHGQSLANTGEVKPYETPDHDIGLTDYGKTNCTLFGKKYSHLFTDKNFIYHSPFQRCKESLAYMLMGSGLFDNTPYDFTKNIDSINNISQEEVRLREVDIGVYELKNKYKKERVKQGWFFYRFPNGESAAEVYDRVCSFYQDMLFRSEYNKDVVIISHGITIRCFIMRALKLTVKDYISLDNPENNSVITIGPAHELQNPVIINDVGPGGKSIENGYMGVEGITIRKNNG